MRRSRIVSRMLVGLVALVGVLSAASCAQSEAIVARDPSDGATVPPAFAATDGGDAEAGADPIPMCVATECPQFHTTCPTTPSGRTFFKCETDLLSDNENCGECGHLCPLFSEFAVATRCVAGACVATCNDLRHKDCNHIPDDGCEAEITKDPQNCGACGNACAPGVRCIEGQCGCPPGKLDCDGECIDPSTNKRHCGACGNECTVPDDAATLPPEMHMEYTCAGGVCGKIDCLHDGLQYWVDCNGDRVTDGCEVDLGAGDVANCGACGHACDPGQRCELTDYTTPPRFECLCKANETNCGEGMGPGPEWCADLSIDVNNCGACGYKCPDANAPHRISTCNQGLCQSECAPGWGDCNGVASDGCETNLRVHPDNCGACGNGCDVVAGQPCVEGRCLTEPCEGDGGVK